MEFGSRDGILISGGDAEGRDSNPFLSFDLLCEVLSRVDALTLAKASCVSTEFRRACEGQGFWERLCYLRWSSTKQPAAQQLIAQTGGFRNFYANCHPSLSGNGTAIADSVHPHAPPESPLRTPTKLADDSDSEPSPSNFISIIDIMYDNQPMLSRIVSGFPGVGEFEWFENCPFQFDLLRLPDEDGVCKDDYGITSDAIRAEIPTMGTTTAQERKVGDRLWKALNDNLTASWILVNKSTGQMANLASYHSVGGLRHWPCEDDFVLHFGTIIPDSPDAVHCDVALRARYSTSATTTLTITELAMKLENLDGARLYGMESVELLGRALSRCSRTISHSAALQSYQEFAAKQLVRKEAKIQGENRRELAATLVSGVGFMVFIATTWLVISRG